jgi:hypothetical protein
MKRHGFSSWMLLATVLAGCAGPGPSSSTEIVAVVHDRLPTDPGDSAWNDAPRHAAGLLLQDMVEPRLLEASTPSVEVRAITDEDRVAFRLVWTDASQDDLPGASRFVDACAVQVPQATGPDVPAPQMGEEGRTVEISYWRASWQASVDGRDDSIHSLYPAATVDHYPYEAASLDPGSEAQRTLELQYAPARALEHGMEGPRTSPVEDLIAQGPGTLAPLGRRVSEGSGRWSNGGWEVVIIRPLPEGLEAGQRTQVAFAVWDGAREEVGARKMRTGWVPFHLRGEEP